MLAGCCPAAALARGSDSRLLKVRLLLLVLGLLLPVLEGLDPGKVCGTGATSRPSRTLSKEAKGSAAQSASLLSSLSEDDEIGESSRVMPRSRAVSTGTAAAIAAAITGSVLALPILHGSARDNPVLAFAWLRAVCCAEGVLPAFRVEDAGGGMPMMGSSSCAGSCCVVLTSGRGTGPLLKLVLMSASMNVKQRCLSVMKAYKSLTSCCGGGLRCPQRCPIQTACMWLVVSNRSTHRLSSCLAKHQKNAYLRITNLASWLASLMQALLSGGGELLLSMDAVLGTSAWNETAQASLAHAS